MVTLSIWKSEPLFFLQCVTDSWFLIFLVLVTSLSAFSSSSSASSFWFSVSTSNNIPAPVPNFQMERLTLFALELSPPSSSTTFSPSSSCGRVCVGDARISSVVYSLNKSTNHFVTHFLSNRNYFNYISITFVYRLVRCCKKIIPTLAK